MTQSNYSLKVNRDTRMCSIVLGIFLLGINSLLAQTVQVVIGTNNVPITEFKYTYNGSTTTQTSGGGSKIQTTLPVNLVSVKVNDGTIRTLDNFNNTGAAVANNNFSSNVTGVDIFDRGVLTSAANPAAWGPKMVNVTNDENLLAILQYDGVSNIPSGDDFDILFVRGLDNDDYLLVGERNGNTHFLLTPLDSTGSVISGANKLHFGNTNGTASSNGNKKYDWNTRFCPNKNQPMYLTAVDVALFGTTQAIYGFRIDNNGQADVKFFGMSENSFEDNPVNTGIPGIEGIVYNDANGFNGDTLLNGIAIDSIENKQLYVSLLDSSNSIQATKAVNSDGTYSFLNLTSGTYKTVIHMDSTGSSTSSLESGWVSTGERNGLGGGHDGTIDGIVSVTLTDSIESNVNFGIEKLPDTDDKSFVLSSSPVLNVAKVLKSTSGMGDLTGSDREDGTKNAGSSFIITDISGLNGNKLFYDFDSDGDFDSNEILGKDSIISGYDLSMLLIKFSGLLSTNLSFDYAAIDAAGMQDPTPATYSVSWTTALPVEFLGVNGKLINDNDVLITWSTASELNNAYFEVQRRYDYEQEFTTIGTVEGSGTSNQKRSYRFTDETNKWLAPVLYYRIKQVDFDGKFEYSYVVAVSKEIDLEVLMYPNPAHSQATVAVVGDNDVTLRVYNSIGNDITGELTVLESDNIFTLDVQGLSGGTYLIQLTSRHNQVTERLIITR